MGRSAVLILLLAGVAACADPMEVDGGLGPLDAGPDAGVRDAGATDLGVLDAQLVDAQAADGTPTDAATGDAAAPDGAEADAEPNDSGPGDGGTSDAEPLDADLADADLADAPTIDAGPMTTTTSTWSPSLGTPDQGCTPWVLVDTANPEDPVVSGGALTLSTSDDAENLYYIQYATELSLPPVLVIEARVRFISGTESTASRAPVNLAFRLGPDLKKNILFLRDGQAFLLSDENVAGPSVSVATSDRPHLYALEVDLSSGAIQVRQDGVSILNGQTFLEPAANAEPAIYFGEGSLYAHGSSEWLSVSHNAHASTACP